MATAAKSRPIGSKHVRTPDPGPTLVIVDVGHGSCAVLQEDKAYAVLDAGPGSAVMDYLDQLGITEIDLLVVSHSDEDHLGGAVALLSDDEYVVKQVLVNPDSSKESTVWRDFRKALTLENNKKNGLKIRIAVYQGKIDEWIGKRTTLEALAPSLENVLAGPGGLAAETGKQMTSNSASVVLRVNCDGRPCVLLAADMEDATLKDMEKNKIDARANVLLFPHHGGRAGHGDLTAFTNDVVKAVQPTTVLFSNGRGRYRTPRSEIMEVVTRIPKVYIGCTQVSKSCSKDQPTKPSSHISSKYAAGAEKGNCCAGSITVDLQRAEVVQDEVRAHQEFVVSLPTPLCMVKPKSIH